MDTAGGLLGDIFGGGGSTAPATAPGAYVPKKEVWLPAAKGKGLEV